MGPESRVCQWWVHGLEQYHCYLRLSFSYVYNGVPYIILVSLLYNGIYVLGLGCYVVWLLYKSMYNLKMANISDGNM